ncbi:MAG: TIGR02206 family membrane protein [Mollicutes bacterium]|nr:TIGR02206 family membrane protein [Mollicutes bacterium]
MSHFFRSVEDVSPLKLFSPIHLILLLIYIIGIVLIYKNNKKLKKSKYDILKIMAIILLIDQIVLYTWQITSGYFRWDMSLPLYHSRIAVPMLIIGIFKNNKRIKILGMYWGLLGSVIAMIMAELYKFSFPHYTNFQFFIVHIIMGWILAYLLFVDQVKITKEDNIFALKITTIYNIALVIFNFILKPSYPNVNYGYMLKAPEFIGPLFKPIIHAILMIIIFNIMMYLLYLFFNFIRKKTYNEKAN